MSHNFITGFLWGALFVMICGMLPVTYCFKIMTQEMVKGLIKKGNKNGKRNK